MIRETIFKGQVLTRQQILDALQEFDWQYPDPGAYEGWLHKDSYKFVVRHEGKLYPPKHILSQATGI